MIVPNPGTSKTVGSLAEAVKLLAAEEATELAAKVAIQEDSVANVFGQALDTLDEAGKMLEQLAKKPTSLKDTLEKARELKKKGKEFESDEELGFARDEFCQQYPEEATEELRKIPTRTLWDLFAKIKDKSDSQEILKDILHASGNDLLKASQLLNFFVKVVKNPEPFLQAVEDFKKAYDVEIQKETLIIREAAEATKGLITTDLHALYEVVARDAELTSMHENLLSKFTDVKKAFKLLFHTVGKEIKFKDIGEDRVELDKLMHDLRRIQALKGVITELEKRLNLIIKGYATTDHTHQVQQGLSHG